MEPNLVGSNGNRTSEKAVLFVGSLKRGDSCSEAEVDTYLFITLDIYQIYEYIVIESIYHIIALLES